MKRTLPVVEVSKEKYGEWIVHPKITCEVTGEMEGGSKVWTDIETGQQYFMFRMLGICYFSKF